jgi:competence protein ComEC
MPNQFKYPFLRILLPFMVGVYFGYYPFFFTNYAFNYFVIITSILICWGSFLFVKSYSFRWVFGLLMSLFMLFSGMTWVNIQGENYKTSSVFLDSTFNGIIEVRILEPPKQKELTTGFVAEITGLQGVNQWKKDKVLVYLQNYPEMPVLKYGSILVIKKIPELIGPSLNPEQFDYQKYQSLKGIFYQVFLKNGEWDQLSGNQSNFIFRTAFWCRDYLLDVLKKNGLQDEEYAVASAILLGYDDELPRHLRKGYVASGTMHVLCVSGLHVGIVYLIFNFLFGLILARKSNEHIKTLMLLAIVWFYAMITGLTPSVLRSTIMISFILIGTLINRRGNIFNSLAASAFLLLLIDPSTLMNIGFQLSYLAVLGIALFQKPFYNLFFFKNKALNWIWEATSVTLAAQLMTTPIILYYFHQFPVYFILSNLLLIPLSFVIIVLGMSVLIFSFLPYVPLWLGYLTSAFIYIMNFIVKWIENLPISTINGLYLTQYELVMLLIIVSLLWIFMQYFNSHILVPILTILIFFSLSVTFRNFENLQTKQIVVFGINKHTAIDFIIGKQHILLSDSSLVHDEFAIDYNMRGYWAKMGLKDEMLNLRFDESHSNAVLLRTKEDLVSFGGKIFSIWTGEQKTKKYRHNRQPLDFVVVVGNRKESLESLLKNYLVETIVIDLSVPYWQADKWKSAAQKSGIQVRDIREEGAYIVDI